MECKTKLSQSLPITSPSSRRKRWRSDLYDSPYTDLALKKTQAGSIWESVRAPRTLKERGINTAYELKTSEPKHIRDYLNLFGARTVRELNGIKCSEGGHRA